MQRECIFSAAAATLRDLAFAQVLARLLSKSSQNTYSVVSGYIHTCLVSESVILQMLSGKDMGSTKLESLNNEQRIFLKVFKTQSNIVENYDTRWRSVQLIQVVHCFKKLHYSSCSVTLCQTINYIMQTMDSRQRFFSRHEQ